MIFKNAKCKMQNAGAWRAMPLLVVILLLIPGAASALDMTLSIPDANVPRVVAAVLAIQPNNECAEWDLKTVTCITKKYADNEWALEVARRILVDGIKRGEQALINQALAEKQAAVKQTEAERIVPPVMDDYNLTIK